VATSSGWRPAQKTTAPASTAPSVDGLPSKAPRLKGKARKAAKEASAASDPTTYLVTTIELVKQVKTVTRTASATRIPIPEKVLTALKAAVSARKRCAAWFEHTQDVSDEGHRYFIDLLEWALRTLHPENSKDQSRSSTIQVPDRAAEPPCMNDNAALFIRYAPDSFLTAVI
jgi:hypothetical protein